MTFVRRDSSTVHSRQVPALTWVMDKNRLVEKGVQECVEKIASINAALKEEMRTHLASNAGRQVLNQSEQVKDRVQEYAAYLRTLNASLATEIRERKKLERTLAGMQINLMSLQIDLLEAQKELARYREKREKEKHRAFYDSVTGLPNRPLFNDRVERAVAHAQRHQRLFAVMFIALDGLKNLEEQDGPHQIADNVLQTAAQRLRGMVRVSDTVGHQKIDEFFYLQEEIANRRNADGMARKLVAVLAQPYEVQGDKVSLVPSIGVAVYPQDGDTADALINNAAIAMYQAKRNNGGCFFFDENVV